MIWRSDWIIHDATWLCKTFALFFFHFHDKNSRWQLPDTPTPPDSNHGQHSSSGLEHLFSSSSENGQRQTFNRLFVSSRWENRQFQLIVLFTFSSPAYPPFSIISVRWQNDEWNDLRQGWQSFYVQKNALLSSDDNRRMVNVVRATICRWLHFIIWTLEKLHMERVKSTKR